MVFLVTWFLLAGQWIGFAGYFDVVHLVFGFCSVTLVSLISSKHLTGGGGVVTGMARMIRLVLYLPRQIVWANLQMMIRIFGMKPIDSVVVRLEPDLRSDLGRVTLANSITLTPGTVTVVIENGQFLIRTLSRRASEGYSVGLMNGQARAVTWDLGAQIRRVLSLGAFNARIGRVGSLPN